MQWNCPVSVLERQLNTSLSKAWQTTKTWLGLYGIISPNLLFPVSTVKQSLKWVYVYAAYIQYVYIYAHIGVCVYLLMVCVLVSCLE